MPLPASHLIDPFVGGCPAARRRWIACPCRISRIFQNENPVAGPRHNASILRLRQREHIAPVEARAQLLPVRAPVARAKHAAIFLVVHHARVQQLRIVTVHENRRNLPLADSLVRRRKRRAPVLARQNAAAIGGQQHAIRIAGIDVHVVHHNVRIRHALKVLTGVDGLVQPLGRSRVHHIALLRILHQAPRPSRFRRNALDPAEQSPRVLALVDSAARAQVNRMRMLGIDDDRKHIRVHNQSLLDVVPCLAAVRSLPWQVPGSRVDRVSVARVYRQRFNLVNLVAARRADLRPCRAAVARPEDSLQCSRIKCARIGRRLRQRVNRLPFEPRWLAPGAAAVVADPQSAIDRVLPRANVNRRRVLRSPPQCCRARIRRRFPALPADASFRPHRSTRRASYLSCPAEDASARPGTPQAPAHRRPLDPRPSTRSRPAGTPLPATIQKQKTPGPEPRSGANDLEHSASSSFRLEAPNHLFQDPHLSLSRIDNSGRKKRRG